MKLTKTSLMVLMSFAGLSFAQAASISLNNASFEAAPSIDHPAGGPFGNNNYNHISTIDGWTLAPTPGSPYSDALTNSSFAGLIGYDGAQAMWLTDTFGDAPTLSQNSSDAFAAGSYTFTIAHAYTGSSNGTFLLEIIDGTGTQLASQTYNATSGATTFQDASVTYSATGSETGNIGVRVSSVSGTDNAVVFDNARLTTTAVPEPSSTALLGLGGLALIMRRRK